MLIRTRSETVERIYEEFLKRFPRPEDLCSTGVEDIEVYFKRLGLIGRAERLKRAVHIIINEYEGSIPCNYKRLIAIPGVGRYIANVLLTRVCRNPTPFVDSNILRFARRFLGLENIDVNYVERWIAKAINRELLEDLNIALLDLSRVICKARKPRCCICILKDLCKYPRKLSAGI